ncbi:MAG: hypothetical protein KGJ66_06700 [Alphaproteobacteria bacterium]|nr:hypothetical protein [Alphaproteobacteria bacterium]
MVSAESTPFSLRRTAVLPRVLWEPVLAAIAAAAFYVSLYGQLPYHDVLRFVAQIDSGKFVWDMGHVWLQPVTLLWHWYLGFGETAEQSQKHINTVFAAAGIGVFYFALMRFEVGWWQRIVAAALVAASCNILTLAPTGHMKLLALPFLTATFYFAVAWERDLAAGVARNRTLVWSGVFMALAASFHSSCLAAPPYVGLVILLASLRHGDGWVKGIGRAALYGATAGLLFLALLETARLVFFGQWLTPHVVAATVGAKDALRTGWFSWSDLIGRMVFGTVNNFIAAPALGPIMRAWLLHQIPSLAPYAGRLIVQAVPWFATLALLAAVYLRSAWLSWKGAALMMPLAFIIGDWSWNLFFNINEPEHWFHITVPTVFLFLMVTPPRLTRIALPLWAAVTIALNLVLWAVPEARYPLDRYQAQLARDYGPNDLFLYFVTYGGGPNMSFFTLPTPHLVLDQLYEKSKNTPVFFGAVEQSVDATFKRGGRVVVFEALDPTNWNAPWMLLTRDGMTKVKFVGFFDSHYKVVPLGAVAGMKAWQLLPRQ